MKNCLSQMSNILMSTKSPRKETQVTISEKFRLTNKSLKKYLEEMIGKYSEATDTADFRSKWISIPWLLCVCALEIWGVSGTLQFFFTSMILQGPPWFQRVPSDPWDLNDLDNNRQSTNYIKLYLRVWEWMKAT